MTFEFTNNTSHKLYNEMPYFMKFVLGVALYFMFSNLMSEGVRLFFF